MNKDISVEFDGKILTFHFEIITNYNDYDRFSLQRKCRYAVADIQVLPYEDGEIVESIILLQDDLRGQIIYLPVNENIEYVERVLKDDRLSFVCSQCEIDAFNAQFLFDLRSNQLIYDHTDQADLVEYFDLVEANAELCIYTPDVAEEQDEFENYLAQFWDITADIISGIIFLQKNRNVLMKSREQARTTYMLSDGHNFQ